MPLASISGSTLPISFSPRRRNLWVTDTLQWRPRARPAQAAQSGGATKRLVDLLVTVEFVHVHADHPLAVALERIGASKLGVLPVVSRANVHKLEGIVTLQDVLALYGVAS